MPGARITHVEFPADDMERAKRFYAAVAGWEFQPMEGFADYELFSTDEQAGGAIGARGTSTGNAIRIFITVPDLERARDAATANGGTARRGHHRRPGPGPLRRGPRSRGQRDRALAEPRLTARISRLRLTRRRPACRTSSATIRRWIWFVPS